MTTALSRGWRIAWRRGPAPSFAHELEEALQRSPVSLSVASLERLLSNAPVPHVADEDVPSSVRDLVRIH